MALTRITFLSSIFCILLIYQCSQLVKADEALVSSVCSRTEQPGYCHQCTNSYPTYSKETIKDLAGTSLECTIFQSIRVHDILLYYNRTTHLKEIGQCELLYLGVTDILNLARGSIARGEYDASKSHLEGAKSMHLTCFNLLIKAKRYIPADLATAFYAFRAYDDVTKNVVSQIK